jgi:hypothetical protein
VSVPVLVSMCGFTEAVRNGADFHACVVSLGCSYVEALVSSQRLGPRTLGGSARRRCLRWLALAGHGSAWPSVLGVVFKADLAMRDHGGCGTSS